MFDTRSNPKIKAMKVMLVYFKWNWKKNICTVLVWRRVSSAAEFQLFLQRLRTDPFAPLLGIVHNFERSEHSQCTNLNLLYLQLRSYILQFYTAAKMAKCKIKQKINVFSQKQGKLFLWEVYTLGYLLVINIYLFMKSKDGI